MPNPASPPINLLGARAEFGLGAGGNGLLDLLRTPGGVVPNGAANAGVPTSPPVGLLNLLGTTNLSYFMGAASAGDSVAIGTARAALELRTDGYCWRTEPGTDVAQFQWLSAGSPSQVDVYAEFLGGTVPTGSAVNTWLNLGSTRTWELARSIVGSASCTLRMHLAPAGSGSSTTNAIWTLTVDKSS